MCDSAIAHPFAQLFMHSCIFVLARIYAFVHSHSINTPPPTLDGARTEMSKHLIELRNGFTGEMPASMPRYYTIIIDGQSIDMDEATHNAVMAKSKADKISAEAAFASLQEIGAAA